MLSENERIELQNNIRDFYNSKKGEKILKKVNKKDLKDFKKKRGWFSPEEDEACKCLKIEVANNMLEKIRGKKFAKNNPFTSEIEAERFIETEEIFQLSLPEFEKY